MPFGSFKTLGEALRSLQVKETEESFLVPVPVTVNDHFRAELSDTLEFSDVDCSEWAVCENLIHPVVREALKPHRTVLGIWSHVSLYNGERLLGVPDYIIAKRSPLSKRLMETPYAMIMEAKKNDFDAGWAQCLTAMDALQTMNGDPVRPIYGIVSDGSIWEFGKLVKRTFALHPLPYRLRDLDELMAALNHVLELCKQQVLSPGHAA